MGLTEIVFSYGELARESVFEGPPSPTGSIPIPCPKDSKKEVEDREEKEVERRVVA